MSRRVYPRVFQCTLNGITYFLKERGREGFKRGDGSVTTEAKIGVSSHRSSNASSHRSWKKFSPRTSARNVALPTP